MYVRVRACTAPRLVPLARYLYYYSHERAARIYREAHRPAARTYLITGRGRPTSTICLSAVGDRPLPATMSYRRPVSLTRTRARERSCHMPLIIARTCDIRGDRYTLARGASRGEMPNRRRFLLISRGRGSIISRYRTRAEIARVKPRGGHAFFFFSSCI